jgi:hypothetical protein
MTWQKSGIGGNPGLLAPWRQGRSYSLEPRSGDLNVVGHLSGFATRQSGVLGIRGPASFDETLGIRAAAIEVRVNKKTRRAMPAGQDENP